MAITASDSVHSLESVSNPITFPFTNNASTDALLVLQLAVRSATARTGGAPTYNAVALTQAGSTITNASGLAIETWNLVAPATGTNTVSIPNSGGLGIAATVSSYNNAAQTSVVNTSNGATGNSGAPSSNVVTTARCLVIGCHAHESKNASSNDQGTLLFSTDEGQWVNGESYVIQTSGGSQTLSWTNGTSDIWAIHVVAFNPFVQQKVLTSSATTTATLAKVALFKRTLATVATMVSAIARQLSLSQVLSVTAVTVPTLAKFVSIFKTFSTTAVTVAALDKIRTFSRTLSATAGTAVSLTTLALHKIAMATTVITVSAMTRFAIRFKTLSVSAVTSAVIFTKGVAMVLKNAANAIVTNTLVKWGIFEYGGGTPSDPDFLSLSDKGTDWTDGSGNLQIPYSGPSGKGDTVYVAVIHPDDTPAESMIWTDTVK